MVASTGPSGVTGDAASRGITRRGFTLLWRSVRHHPRIFSISVAGAVLFAFMTVASTMVLGRLTDDVIIPGVGPEGVDASTVAGVAAAVLVIAVLRALGVIARRYYCGRTTFSMSATWRQQLTDRYVDAPLGFFTHHPSGRLMAHADNDATVATSFINPAPFSFSALVIGVVALARLLMVDVVLAGVAVLVFPALIVMNHLYTRRVEAPAARAQARYGDLASVAHESFDGALVVKTLGLGEHEGRRLARAADALRAERVRVGLLRAWIEPGLEAVPALGSVAVLGLGAWRLSTGDVTEGGIVEALALFAALVLPMRVMGYLLEEMPNSVVAADRLDDVLAVPADERHPARGDRPLPAGPLGLTLDSVSFAHVAGAPVLSSVAAEIAPGEVVALVGATAAGKSTLCQLVTGLLEPSSGAVRVGGIDVRELDRAALTDAVAMVFQESFLFADSVRENVVLGDAVDGDALTTALRVARAEGFTAALPEGLDTVVGERGVTLSGGQRQRLALARALVRRPRLLVLDDATSAIDPRVEQQILAGLREELSTTTLVVAHRVATIRLAERVLYVDGGRIRASGTHDELLASDRGYAALVSAYEDTTGDITGDTSEDTGGEVADEQVSGGRADDTAEPEVGVR